MFHISSSVRAAAVVLGGAVRHQAICGLLGCGLRTLAAGWHWDDARTLSALVALRGLLGEHIAFRSSWAPSPGALPEPAGKPRFQYTTALFGAALACGWPWATAFKLAVFSNVHLGSFCKDGRGFLQVSCSGGLLSSERLLHGQWQEGLVSAPGDNWGPPVRVWFNETGVVYHNCLSSLRLGPPARHGPPLAKGASDALVPAGSRPMVRTRSHFLPEYIRMRRDEHGNIVIARHLLTLVFQQRRGWARLIPVDRVTRAIVNCMACYPQISWRTLASWKPDPPGWNNPEAKAAIGYKFGQWVYKSDLEWAPDGAPLPLVIEPQSFVDKKGKEKLRNISDSQIGNEMLDKWGVRYYSARDFSDGLSPCAIVLGSDVTEGYHIAKLPGCLADLIWSWGITGMRTIYQGDLPPRLRI
jgi:hypothetical protein